MSQSQPRVPSNGAQATFAGDETLLPQPRKRADADTLEQALHSLLEHRPEAPVAAMGPNGVLVPMPDSIPLQRNPVLEARSGLDLILEEDRIPVLSTWDQILAEGAGHRRVHLTVPPGGPVTFYGFDLREVHGVILAVYVPAGEDDSPTEVADAAPAGRTLPRFATIHKDDRSFIIKVDQAITEILGWSAEEMVGRRSLDFIHPDDHPLAIDNWVQMQAVSGMGRRVRLRHRHRDKSWVWFEVTNHNLLDDPDQRCVISEMVDISDEMIAQEALRAREEVLARLAETIPLGLLQTDANGGVTYTNDRLHEILGVKRTATFWEQLSTVAEADRQALMAALDGVRDQGADADAEVELRVPPSGELRFCTINIRALRRKDGTISGAIACVVDVTDSVHMREELKKRATFDRLTGCYNRESIIPVLEANIASGGPDADRAVMFIDLDRFKEVNDRNGHAVGDELLSTVAERLRGVLRKDDLVGRIGGDEFLVLCPNIGSPHQAMRLAERLSQAIRGHGSRASGNLDPLASIGVAWSKGASCDADVLVAQADGAMYESKDEGLGAPKLADATTPERDRSSTGL
jgi:diguanylate cyclase (GGDEF)-like protein/PAS domain S-box-containing protein